MNEVFSEAGKGRSRPRALYVYLTLNRDVIRERWCIVWLSCRKSQLPQLHDSEEKRKSFRLFEYDCRRLSGTHVAESGTGATFSY